MNDRTPKRTPTTRLLRARALAPMQAVCVALVAVWIGAGCGAAFSTRDHTPSAETGTATGFEQAELPTVPIDVLREWNTGDAAFQSGNAATAQIHFGSVYLADPSFGNGQVVAALNETCRILQNDCILVMGRLDALRIVYSQQYGPRANWVDQQSTDYDSVLQCYDDALAGSFDSAYAAGYGVVNAPLPEFAGLARVCLDRVQLIQAQLQAREMWTRASSDWDSNHPAFEGSAGALRFAIDNDDWDAIVDFYPTYKISEEVIGPIVDSGALAQDPERGPAVAAAAETISVVREWEEDSFSEYEAMRNAINDLERDPGYNTALIEYERAYAPVPGLRDEIATLEVAASATSGAERASIDRRIEVKEGEIREIRRDLRRAMVPINELRTQAGLPPRDAPFGLE